jgi:hypothetical protein
MELKAPIGLYITSYEVSNEIPRPILSHIFWGEDLKEVYQYAKSHLISDAFFNATLSTGQLPWNDSVLVLTYKGEYLTTKNTKHHVNATIKKLVNESKSIHDTQTHKKLVQTVQHLSKQLNDI